MPQIFKAGPLLQAYAADTAFVHASALTHSLLISSQTTDKMWVGEVSRCSNALEDKDGVQPEV